MRGLTGAVDFFTANAFDLDKRGNLFGGGEKAKGRGEKS